MPNIETLRYTKEHEWLDEIEAGIVLIGITDYAAQQLGDVVYVDLPEVGDSVAIGNVCGELESTKSVGELYSPVDGEVIEVNQAVIDSPELVNQDPFGDAWLIKIATTGYGETIDYPTYIEFTKE